MVKHWIDELADKLAEELSSRSKDIYVFNGGLSISGLQHIGRLRGEIILGEVLRRILSERGFRIKQYITLYVMDEWKGKETQLRAFTNPSEAIKYTGWPLFKIPDPKGCHSSWIEHFWGDFGPFIKEFTDGEVEPVYTSELYRGKMREFVKKTFELRDRVIETLNKYRGVKLSRDHIPFQPICEKCGRINSTESIEIIDGERVRYKCRNCGFEGVRDISDGKLSWRIEWVGVWWSLGVDFEPYGKDHATPGGSRDSCSDLAMNIYGFKPPFGLPFEWIALKTNEGVRDMGSSDFIGITPREWLEVAHPHVFRFIVLKTPLMKKIIIDPLEIPQYYSQYFKAERVFYGLEEASSEEEKIILSRTYELSYPRGKPPSEPPEQVSYIHLAILSQIVPRELWSIEGIKRLKMSSNLPDKPTIYGLRRIIEMIEKANNWIYKYAPSDFVIKLLPEPSRELLESIPPRHIEILKRIGSELEKLVNWSEESIKEVLVKSTVELDPVERNEFYKSFYKLILGRISGPRVAPLLAVLGREEALKYFKKL